MIFTVGSLVKARGREWVVLPGSNDEVLILRPLGGTEDTVTGISRALERIEPAAFALPDVQQLGDYRSCRLLRDAVRLGFRSSAGPFRSFARIAVEPRPYQLVPLLMALKLDPVRLLIADDVGIGKTIEAGLVARELLDRGEIQRLAVLCPPHLAEQWQVELYEKFHIDAVLVLSSTAAQLERDCRLGQSIFERYAFVIVSIDFIKADRRRDEFLRTCPEFVIVDEAHSAADTGAGRGGHQQRYQVVASLAANPARHLLLVTATPHSGNEGAFRSLLTLLNRDFRALPQDLTGREHERERRHLAAHVVQRRRSDIRAYLQTTTPFPQRVESEQSYMLTPTYKQLFDRVMSYAREMVIDPLDNNKHRQRIRWWSALALLRSLSSSPAAAAATLRNRAASADTETAEEADALGRHTVLDLLENESIEGVDLVAGSDYEDEQANESTTRRRLRAMAREADALQGAEDAKLLQAVNIIAVLLKDGFHPIVFCRFIPTAEYVAQELSTRLPKGVQIEVVTGLLPSLEREIRIRNLEKAEPRVLVCTDCLSEGINLQACFDAVLHYDLSWNPTRHEQREGRVDRYGQLRDQVRMVTYYGRNNPIDGIVLDVLIKKHYKIRSSLGISVPVPVNSDRVLEAVFEGLLLRGHTSEHTQLALPLQQDPREAFFIEWEAASEREKRSRTMFAQESIDVSEVSAELEAMRAVIGSSSSVEQFTREALHMHGALVTPLKDASIEVDFSEVPSALRETLTASLHQTTASGESGTSFKARFQMPVHEDMLYLSRTHPLVEGLATYVMETALEPVESMTGSARRCGVISTDLVSTRTTLLLLRIRYHIITQWGDEERPLLAEDCQVLAFRGSATSAQWFDEPPLLEQLLAAHASENVAAERARHFLRQVLDAVAALQPHLELVARQRGEALLAAHRRVRSAAQIRGIRYRVEAQLPVDILGTYIYLPRSAEVAS